MAADTTPLPAPAPPPPQRAAVVRTERAVAAVLIACVAVVAFWEIMVSRSARAHAPFALTAADFATFEPPTPAWTVRRLELPPDPLEPNIVAFLLTPRTAPATPASRAESRAVLVRLVHGYNMVDCMRIKGETVTLLADARIDLIPPPTVPPPPFALPRLPANLQLWWLTSPTAAVSIWATSMLEAGSLTAINLDTRSMPFPRIGTPDHPGWFPRGLSWSSLRHPIRNGRLFLRAKWNASRADLLTFLGLRQPAYASDEVLTLVAVSLAPTVRPGRETEVAADVVAAHAAVADALRDWRRTAHPPAAAAAPAPP